jgi:serine/threonine-protein kinase
MNESNLDRALAEGFGEPGEHSVLCAIERITGEAPRIVLRDSNREAGASTERKSIPERRGSYQILGEIARGGMGVVMKGHDTDLGRDVALKVLHKELAKRPEVLQRFVEEAQIGGQLQHPGIVPVYELGLMADERPYFTMKLVKGRTLAALLAERKSASVDRRRLLDVFESICQTMAYAHSRGVIHRDLKPANVMVGAFGEVQVVDWGLAKVLRQGGTADEKRAKQTNISIIETVRSEPGSNGSHSLVGSVMGTPAYMSPEQARGEIEKLDERSDVFSLGAILCEILTGAPPYLGERDKTLVEAANARLDDATKRLDGCEADPDLVALCRECLTPAQSARPRSAEIVAQRIHGHLISVEERARQAQVDAAEARVKAHEERRSRKLTVGLAASVLVTVLLAGGGWAWVSNEASRRERDTETQVNLALNEATLKRGEGDWASALAAAERAKGLADSGTASADLRSRTARDLSAIESDAQLARKKDEVASENVALLAALADIRQPEGDEMYTNDWAKLDAEHRAIFARYRLDLDPRSEPGSVAALGARGIPVELAAALDEWAAVRSRAEDKAGAAYLSSLARRIDADATRNKLRDALLTSNVVALKAFAANEDLAGLPATTLDLLGAALNDNGALEDGLAVYRKAEISHPGDFSLAMNLARTLLGLSPPLAEEASRHLTAALALRPLSAEAAHNLGRTLDDVLKDPGRAVEVFRTAVVVHPGDGHLRAHLAESLRELGDLDAAIAMGREAIALAPKEPWPYLSLGIALRKKRDFDGAIEAARTVIELDPKNAAAYGNLANALADKGEADRAIEYFRKALAIDPRMVGVLDNLGTALANKGELDAAIENWCKALAIDPRLAKVHVSMGVAFLRKKECAHAIESFRKAIGIDPQLADAYYELGIALWRNGDLDPAIESLRRAIALDPGMAKAHYDLGLALCKKGDPDGAIQSLRMAIELDPRKIETYGDLSNMLLQEGRIDEAIEVDRNAIVIDPDFAASYDSLGNGLYKKGDVPGAIPAYCKAIELDGKRAVFYNHLASALLLEKDVAGAIAAYRSAVELDPRSVTDLGNLGSVLSNSGAWDEAIEFFHKALAIDPRAVEPRRNLGMTQVRKGDFAGAIESYRQVIAIDPGHVPTLNDLAWILATGPRRELRDPAEAVRLARHAVELTPREPSLWNTLGVALCVHGEPAESVSALQRSIEMNSGGNPYDWLFLAMAEQKLGHTAEARSWYEKSVQWLGRNADSEELARFREEARAVIEAGAKR